MRAFRAFLGVPLGDDVLRSASDLSVELRVRLRDMGAGGAKWVPPQNMHLTLRFLGNVEAGQVPGIKEALGPVVRRHSSFLARLGSLGAFPDASRPSVLWVGVLDGAEALANLAVDVSRTMTGLGFPEESRPFHAHLTLARFRRGTGPDITDLVASHSGLEVGSSVVREVLLFESRPRPRGSVYEAVWRAPLHPGGAPPRQGGHAGPHGPSPGAGRSQAGASAPRTIDSGTTAPAEAGRPDESADQ